MARRYGMRLVGPNCMGVVNTAPDVSMNATFAPVAPLRGRLGFSSQSGGLGIAILSEATRRDLGMSSFVSVGNKADVSGNDLLRYWEEDAGTTSSSCTWSPSGTRGTFPASPAAHRPQETHHRRQVRTVRAGSRGASSHTAAMATPDASRRRPLPAGRGHPCRDPRGALRRRRRPQSPAVAEGSRVASSATPAGQACSRRTPARGTGYRYPSCRSRPSNGSRRSSRREPL